MEVWLKDIQGAVAPVVSAAQPEVKSTSADQLAGTVPAGLPKTNPGQKDGGMVAVIPNLSVFGASLNQFYLIIQLLFTKLNHSQTQPGSQNSFNRPNSRSPPDNKSFDTTKLNTIFNSNAGTGNKNSKQDGGNNPDKANKLDGGLSSNLRFATIVIAPLLLTSALFIRGPPAAIIAGIVFSVVSIGSIINTVIKGGVKECLTSTNSLTLKLSKSSLGIGIQRSLSWLGSKIKMETLSSLLTSAQAVYTYVKTQVLGIGSMVQTAGQLLPVLSLLAITRFLPLLSIFTVSLSAFFLRIIWPS